jgi:signal recognition particle receptor subunit beta
MDNQSGRAQGPPKVYPLVPAGISTQTLSIASLSLAVLCLAVFIIFSRRKSRSRGNALLLVGPPDAGKTAILSTLVYGQTLPTHTSLQINSSVCTLPSTNKTLRIVDVPGHPRVRDQFQEHLTVAKAIVFVVDASTVSRNGPAVAEHLHHILHALTSLPPSQELPKLLILAHKTDLLKSGSSLTTTSSTLAINRVKSILERELEKRRASQSGGVGVEGLGAEGERSDMGGLECNGPGAFRFAEWEGGDIEFIGAYVKVESEADEEKSGNVHGLDAFWEWVHEIS